jgi:hypothetical protein
MRIDAEQLTAVWLTAAGGTPPAAIEQWCARWAGGPDSRALVQVTGGAGAMLVGPDAPAADGGQLWTGRREGRFRLRVLVAAPASSTTGRPSGYLLSTRLFVPDEERRADVRRWLDEEHSGRQLAVAGTTWYAGYEDAGDGPFSFLNLWGIDDPAVIETPEWARARDTEWRGRLMDAFVHTERAVYRA